MWRVLVVLWSACSPGWLWAQAASVAQDLDARKLAVEEKKLAIEESKLALERRKQGFDILIGSLGALGIAVPLLAAAWTLRDQRINRKEEAKVQFQLKAAEIAMAARDSTQVQNKARLLKTLFPDWLPDGFAENFNPKSYQLGTSMERREGLVKLLAEHPESREEIIRAWDLLFPFDNDNPWFRSLKEDRTVNRNRAAPVKTDG